jgi:hypothetical protein
MWLVWSQFDSIGAGALKYKSLPIVKGAGLFCLCTQQSLAPDSPSGDWGGWGMLRISQMCGSGALGIPVEEVPVLQKQKTIY